MVYILSISLIWRTWNASHHNKANSSRRNFSAITISKHDLVRFTGPPNPSFVIIGLFYDEFFANTIGFLGMRIYFFWCYFRIVISGNTMLALSVTPFGCGILLGWLDLHGETGTRSISLGKQFYSRSHLVFVWRPEVWWSSQSHPWINWCILDPIASSTDPHGEHVISCHPGVPIALKDWFLLWEVDYD